MRCRACGPRCGRRPRGGEAVVAEDLRASGGELGHRLAVGPVRHRLREQAAHRRLVMVGEVVVGRAGSDGAGADQGERRERARMIERGHLGDHPADADPCEVRRPAAEHVGQGRRVGGEVAQAVGGRLRVRRRRLAAIAQVVAHHAAPADGETLAQRVGPREHRRPARQQDEWSVVVTEGLDAQGDLIGVDGGHHRSADPASLCRRIPTPVLDSFIVAVLFSLVSLSYGR